MPTRILIHIYVPKSLFWTTALFWTLVQGARYEGGAGRVGTAAEGRIFIGILGVFVYALVELLWAVGVVFALPAEFVVFFAIDFQMENQESEQNRQVQQRKWTYKHNPLQKRVFLLRINYPLYLYCIHDRPKKVRNRAYRRKWPHVPLNPLEILIVAEIGV